MTPIAFLLFFRTEIPDLRPRELALPGLCTGCSWAIGNLCSTYATFYLGQSVGYPLTQTCIVVAGLWGALFFGELRGWKSLSLFGVSVCVIIGGASMLGLFG